MENLLLDSAELEQNPLKKLAKRILQAFEIRENACKDGDWDEEHTQMVEIKDCAVDLAGIILDVQQSQAKFIESVTTDKVELEVYECECGFHLGIDATYIDQVSDCSFICPSCGISISTIRKLKFSTINEGLEAIKQACDEAEISEGEFADYLVLNYSECFDGAVEPVIAIQAIQKFRQSDYETEGEDAIETFGGAEVLSDNGYYGFIFMRNGQSMQLPDGVRVGIQTEDGGIALDEGIVACFKETKCFNANDYTTRQLIEMEFENLPDSEHKDNMIDEALQLVEECGYTVGEATNEVNVANLTPRYCIVQNTDEEGSSTLEDYDTLEKAMEAYNYIKENGCHKSENDDEIVQLESGTKISMDIEWWTHEYNSFVKHEGIDVPVITIQCSEKRGV